MTRREVAVERVTRELEAVRRTAQRLLLAQVVLRWLAVVLAVMLACGAVDYALRLPGWLRLLVALGLGAAAVVSLARGVLDAMEFRPGLGMLALRAERLYPQLNGVLASGVEFAAHPEEFAGSPLASAMASAAVAEMMQKLRGVSISRLIDPRRTLRFAAVTLVVLGVFAGVTTAAPGATWLAAQRWFLPLGSAQWPRRTGVVSLVHETVWPSDTPLRLVARIEKGYRRGMRTWVVYRTISPGENGWRWLLMNDQGDGGPSAWAQAPAPPAPRGDFERLLDLPALSSGGVRAVEFYFQAGDDQTQPQHVALVDRPAVTAVTLETEPPAYAHGLVAPQAVVLDDQAGPVSAATALVGSRIALRFEFNKPPADRPSISDWAPVLPGLIGVTGAAFTEDYPSAAVTTSPAARYAVKALFTLAATMQTPIHVIDDHGLTNLSERAYRVEAITDQPPAVSVVQPQADEAVLPTAVLPVEAMAQDDIAVESVVLEGRKFTNAAGKSVPAGAPTKLQEAGGRVNRLNVGRELSVAAFQAQPGDEVVLTATACDVYELEGRRHAPVYSAPRRLRVIDEATLVSQVRAELGGVRQQAVRLEQQQRDLADAPAEKAQNGQRDINQRLDAQASVLRGIKDRIRRNRLEDAQLNDLARRAADLIDQAAAASRRAGEKLGEAGDSATQRKALRAEARAAQEEADRKLTDLIGLLDQGRDTLGLQIQLQQILGAQDALAGDTRQALPRTLGKTADQLTPEEKRALALLAEKQAALSGRAEALSRQMRGAADNLERDPKDPRDQAAAQALREAVAIAERQGLQPSMQQAAAAAGQNRLSEAGQAQQAGIDTMKKMLDQLGSQEARQQEVLHRRLTALAEAIAKLVEQQKAQIEKLKQAVELAGLDAAATTLRHNTLAVAEDARAARSAAAAAKLLDDAGEHQAAAIGSLRGDRRGPAADAERLALANLESALEEVRKLDREAQDQQQRQERERLKAEYVKLAKEQDDIVKQSGDLAAVAAPTRRQRADVIELGNRQADVRIAAGKLADQVKETVLFDHMHQRIDAAALRAVTRLRAAQIDDEVIGDEGSVAAMLWGMAQALDDAQKQPGEFAEQSGSGGGGSGGRPALIPPGAELKLLRSMQDAILKNTRALAERQSAPAGEDQRRRNLLRLSTQQRDLANLGEELVNSLRQHLPPDGAPGTAAPREKPTKEAKP